MKEDKKYASAPAEIATVASTSKEKKAVKANKKAEKIFGCLKNLTKKMKKIASEKKIVN